MAGEWKEVLFSQLCDITRGASPRPIHDWIADEGVPWVKISDASAARSRFITQTSERIKSEGRHRSVEVHPGDLILSNSATPGIPKFMGIDACIHDGWMLLRNLRGLDRTFAYYLLLYERPKLVEQGNGSVFTNLKTEILKSHRIQLPPLVEQHAIAHILGMLDDKIELNRRMSETLEAMARTLFKSWFVDFDPVRAKAEGRDPGLPQPLADLFPDSFEDSELGEIPRGWEVGSLDCALVLQRGFDLPATQRTSGKYPVLAASGPSGTHDEFMALGPGVTTGRSGVLGKVFYVAGKFWPLNTSLWVKEFRHSKPAYAFHLLHLLDLGLLNAGSAVPTLNRNHVHMLPTLLPPLAFIDAFERFAIACLARQGSNDDNAIALARIRDTLLPKLISGELRVKDAERFIGKVM